MLWLYKEFRDVPPHFAIRRFIEEYEVHKRPMVFEVLWQGFLAQERADKALAFQLSVQEHCEKTFKEQSDKAWAEAGLSGDGAVDTKGGPMLEVKISADDALKVYEALQNAVGAYEALGLVRAPLPGLTRCKANNRDAIAIFDRLGLAPFGIFASGDST